MGVGGSGLGGRLGMRSSRGSGGLGGAGVVVLGAGTLAAWGLRGSMGLSMLHSFHCTTLQHTFLYTRPRLCPHMQVCTDIPTHTVSLKDTNNNTGQRDGFETPVKSQHPCGSLGNKAPREKSFHFL